MGLYFVNETCAVLRILPNHGAKILTQRPKYTSFPFKLSGTSVALTSKQGEVS